MDSTTVKKIMHGDQVGSFHGSKDSAKHANP